MIRYILLGISVWLLAFSAMAQTKTCDALSSTQKKLSQKLMASEFLYDCCDDTVAVCLKTKPHCSLANRLANDICRMIAAQKKPSEIKRALQKRAMSMMPTPKTPEIDLDPSMMVGDPKAPVTLVEYACTRCPFCQAITPKIHHMVTEGALKGKVRLFYRPFPIRNHEGSTEGGLALVAAAQLGQFWPYLLALYDDFDQFSADATQKWAVQVGLDKTAFSNLVSDPKTRDQLVTAKKEGLKNGVSKTPTFYINGREYVYELTVDALLDVLAEEHERVVQGQ